MWTPQMVLDNRNAREGELGHTSWFYVGCTCIPCRNFYDPTGEKDANNWNDQEAERVRECHEAGVPEYGDFSSLNFSEQMKKLLSDAYAVSKNFQMAWDPSYDNVISMSTTSFYLSTFADQLKLKENHTEETFKEVVIAMRDIQKDGWIEFAKKNKT